jgi:hypothetical protein
MNVVVQLQVWPPFLSLDNIWEYEGFQLAVPTGTLRSALFLVFGIYDLR